jgi:pimeloyl-ACP methyl ester carboxylesterase
VAGLGRTGLDEPPASLLPVVVATRRLVRAAALGLAVGGLASAAYQILSDQRDLRRYPPLGELVDIGGRRLHLMRAGGGTPAVVVATSLGEPGHGWAEIQRHLAQHTTVVLYDRAGLGWSDPGPWPTGKQMVEDLHALLGAAGIPAPYVLVGHSVGGLLVRLYARRYPEEVVGLVLVDSSHPDQWRDLSKLDWRRSGPAWWLRVARIAVRPLGLTRLCAAVRARRHGADIPPHLRRGLSPEQAEAAVTMELSSRQRRADVQEMAAFPGLTAEVGRAVSGAPGSLGWLPLTVISRSTGPPSPWPPHFEAAWQAFQTRQAALSERSVHLHAESADHFVPRAHPGLVVRAIIDLIEQVRSTMSSDVGTVEMLFPTGSADRAPPESEA